MEVCMYAMHVCKSIWIHALYIKYVLAVCMYE